MLCPTGWITVWLTIEQLNYWYSLLILAQYPDTPMALTLDEIRKRIVIALFSDDDLLNSLVLKGGNALELIHGVSERATVDMDFSMGDDFEDLGIAERKIRGSLESEFARVGFVVFDFSIEAKPPELRDNHPPWWGGYLVNFKICSKGVYDEFSENLDAIRRRAEVLGPANKKIFKIDISKHEFCDGKERRELDDYTLYAYSLPMIVIEKLRAICQQMEPYPHTLHKRPRPRDFFDIYQILSQNQIDLGSADNSRLARSIFEAKQVPLTLLRSVNEYRSFHAADWDSVTLSVKGSVQPFDFYFDYVVAVVDGSEAFWDV